MNEDITILIIKILLLCAIAPLIVYITWLIYNFGLIIKNKLKTQKEAKE